MVARPKMWRGSCALICRGDANSIGIGFPLMVRHDSPIAVGSGISRVAMLVGFRFEPNTVIKDPGATRPLKSAALPTRTMAGAATGESKSHASAVKPDVVRAI